MFDIGISLKFFKEKSIKERMVYLTNFQGYDREINSFNS